MSAYRVEVQRGRNVWVRVRVGMARDHSRAMARIIREKLAEDATAIRAVREYGDGNLSEGIRRSARMIEKWKQPFS